MLGKNYFRKIITSLTTAAVVCVYSSIALAAAKDITGEITVTAPPHSIGFRADGKQ